MTEKELNAIINAIKVQTHESIKHTGSTWVAEASSNAIEATFIKLGIDCKKPIEVQKDFAYLRQSRSDSEDRRKTLMQAVTKWTSTIILSAISAGAVAWTALQGRP